MKAIVEGKKVELTDWFPPDVKPVRPGWYQSVYCDFLPNKKLRSDWNMYWDGEKWFLKKNSLLLRNQNRWWRGLTKPFDQS